DLVLLLVQPKSLAEDEHLVGRDLGPTDRTGRRGGVGRVAVKDADAGFPLSLVFEVDRLAADVAPLRLGLVLLVGIGSLVLMQGHVAAQPGFADLGFGLLRARGLGRRSRGSRYWCISRGQRRSFARALRCLLVLAAPGLAGI